MIRDFNMEWLEARVFIPAQAFTGYVAATTAGTFEEPTSANTGAAELTELSTFGLVGLQIGAAGDMVSTIWMTPYDLDITKQIRFRVWWTQSSTTATDTIDWIVTYQRIVEESTVLVDPVTALNTVVPLADASSGTAWHMQASGFGIINRNTLVDTNVFLNLRVEADAIGTFSADEPFFLGLEIRYTPRRAAGPRRNILGGRRLLNANPLGVRLHATQEGL